jgi:ABC-2 type transport system ATP-binding protein
MHSEPSSTVACQHLTKRFGTFTAVNDISFTLSGGICALLGPNGAGKSTLLKLLTGLLVPDQGEVRIAGVDIARDPRSWKRLIGVVPEDLGLFDSLTIEEHLELCGPVYGLDRIETAERTDSLLRALGLNDRRRTFLDQCSHGMRKKTALAMAILHKPRVLFLDEPFEGVDLGSLKAICDLLTTLVQNGVTVVLSSHLLALVNTLATRIMIMRGGHIVWNSGVAEISVALDELYFSHIGIPAAEDLAWLRS